LVRKLRIEGETADQLLARLVKGEEDRGGCTLICKKSRQRDNAQDWRLSCCFGDHDKSAQKAAASVGQPLLMRGAEGAAPDTGVAAVRNVRMVRTRSTLRSRKRGARNWQRGNLSRLDANSA
jgi:hypothetical protein